MFRTKMSVIIMGRYQAWTQTRRILSSHPLGYGMDGNSQNATEPSTLLMCYPLAPSFLSKKLRTDRGRTSLPWGPCHPLAHQCTPPLARPLPTWGVCVVWGAPLQTKNRTARK